MGTCLGNMALLEEKKKNLIDFVKATEPGMMYLHGMDICRQDESKRAWAARCPDCRKRWPNDAVNAPDGMAGAFAEFYDELYDAIASVKNPENGYDAARDCIVNMVSPNYTDYHEPDTEWQYHINYFKTLSGCLRNKDIYLLFREQFFNEAEGGPRFMQMRKAVGAKQKLSVVYFSSGSSFYNSFPVTADAACIRYFGGMDSVIAGSGNAFQEPRQAINAEYMWNPDGSRFKLDDLPDYSSKDKFLPCYHELTRLQKEPDVVFGKDGLLEVVCGKLYGKTASALVCLTQKPEKVMKFDIDFIRAKPIVPLLPLTNDLIPGYVFSVFFSAFKGPRVYWHEQMTPDIIEYVKAYLTIMDAIIKATDNTVGNYSRAASLCESELPIRPELRISHLKRMAETSGTGKHLAELICRWLDVLMNSYERVNNGKDSNDLQSLIDDLRNSMELFAGPLRNSVKKAIDPNKGDVGQAIRAVDFMIGDLCRMSHTLKTGKYLEVKIDKWW